MDVYKMLLPNTSELVVPPEANHTCPTDVNKISISNLVLCNEQVSSGPLKDQPILSTNKVCMEMPWTSAPGEPTPETHYDRPNILGARLQEHRLQYLPPLFSLNTDSILSSKKTSLLQHTPWAHAENEPTVKNLCSRLVTVRTGCQEHLLRLGPQDQSEDAGLGKSDRQSALFTFENTDARRHSEYPFSPFFSASYHTWTLMYHHINPLLDWFDKIYADLMQVFTHKSDKYHRVCIIFYKQNIHISLVQKPRRPQQKYVGKVISCLKYNDANLFLTFHESKSVIPAYQTLATSDTKEIQAIKKKLCQLNWTVVRVRIEHNNWVLL